MWADKQLETAQRAAGKVQDYLAEASVMWAVHERNSSGFQMENFFECIREASFCSERLTERLRRLVLEHCVRKTEREVYGRELVYVHGIRVDYEDGILQAELPFLMPHRKHPYTDYLYKPFLLALENWCRERKEQGREIPDFEQATVCFAHMYEEKGMAGRIRDHDNIEEKQMVDALGMFFLSSDGGLFLDTYHTTILGERNRTFLFLMEPERFSRWIFGGELQKAVSKKQDMKRLLKSTG